MTTSSHSLRIIGASFLSYILIIYSFFSLYIIPYNTIPFAKLFIPIILVLLGFELFDGKTRVNLTDIILSSIVIITNIVPEFSLNRFADAVIIIALLFKFKRIEPINPLFLLIFNILGLSALVYNILFSRFSFDNTILVINNPDPNFSGYMALLLLFFFAKNGFKLGIGLCIICAILLWSRNYMLALAIFFSLGLAEKCLPRIYRNIFKKINLVSLISIFLVLNLSVILYGLHFLTQVKAPVSLGFARNDVNRVINLQDDSNWYRFNANKEFLDLMVKEQDILLFGVSGARPNLDEQKARRLLPTRVPPHNSIFQLLMDKGIIFSTFYFLTLLVILKRLYCLENFKYILPVLVFGLFLHAIYGGSFIIFLVSLLSLPEKKQSTIV